MSKEMDNKYDILPIIKILWVEDNDEWYDAAIELVKKRITKELYLYPQFKRQKNAENILNEAEHYHITLVDLNLGQQDGKQGNDVIKEIRDNGLMTEVLFYSSSGEKKVREKVVEHKLDGVYCADRKEIGTGDENDKLLMMVKETIRKIHNHISTRGYYAFLSSCIEKLLEDIIRNICADDKKKETIFYNISEDRDRQNEDIKKIIDNENLEKIFRYGRLPAMARIDLIKKEAENIKFENGNPIKVLKDFFKDRNSVIHVGNNEKSFDELQKIKKEIYEACKQLGNKFPLI